MRLNRDIRTVTDMKTRSAQLLAQINEERRPVVITQDGRPRAVMLDVESYEGLRRAVAMLQMISQSERDFAAGRWVSQDKVFVKLQARYGGKARGRRTV